MLIDREQGGAEDLAEHGLHLHAVLTLREMVDALEQSQAISSGQARRVQDYLASGA